MLFDGQVARLAPPIAELARDFVLVRVTRMRGVNLALFGLVISFWTSVIIRSYAWLVLLGANGLVNDFLGLLGIGPLTLLFNETGVVIGVAGVHVFVRQS